MNIPFKANPGTPYGCISGCQTHYPHFETKDPCVVLVKSMGLEHNKNIVFISVTHQAYGKIQSGIMVTTEQSCLILSLQECQKFAENINQAIKTYQEVVKT